MGQAPYEKFSLGDSLTDEQKEHFKRFGFLHFRDFITSSTVRAVWQAILEVQEKWLAEDVVKVNGVPIRFGTDVDGGKIVQRFAFASQFHPLLSELAKDPRMGALLELNGQGSRIGENEKNGMVVNHYVNHEGSNFKQMGWHTDALRDLFYGRRVGPMLNVGIHLDDQPTEKGGLRLLPGTHTQNMWSMMFHKRYFVDNRPDPKEIGFDIKAGDLTVHDGRLWHRVQRSTLTGEASRRRVIYIPIVNGVQHIMHEHSPTPIYLRFSKGLK